MSQNQTMATVVKDASSSNTNDNCDTINNRPAKQRRLDSTDKGYEVVLKPNEEYDFTIKGYGYRKLHPVFDKLERALENGTCYQKIKEGQIEWKYSKQHSMAIMALLEAEEIKHGAGLHSYDLGNTDFNPSQEGIDLDTRNNPTLITREHSRGVVDVIFKKIDKEINSTNCDTVSYIIGPPGVGKTRTLQYMLRKYLLQGGKRTARYYSQKDEFALWIMLVGKRLWVYRTELAGKCLAPHGPLLRTRFNTGVELRLFNLDSCMFFNPFGSR